MDSKKLANQIITLIGGAENVYNVMHCITRLRFELNDPQLASSDKLKETEGVISVIQQSGQYQVVIGSQVAEVFQQVTEQLDLHNKEDVITPGDNKKKEKIFDKLIGIVSGVIVPVLPVLTSAGILKGVLALCSAMQWLSKDSGAYLLLDSTADAFFYFMPILLGFSAGKKFNINPYTTAVLGAVLVHPLIVAAWSGQSAYTFFGIPIVLMNYSASIFPIIVGAWVSSKIEPAITRRLSTSFNIFTPLFVLIIVVPLTLLVFGPLTMMLSDFLSSATNGLYNINPILAGILLGAFWQSIVMLGLHWAFIPIMINNITVNGMDPLNAIFACTVFTQAGATLGVALKTRLPKVKALASSCTVSGLFGITEPAIYGITLVYKKPFIMAMIAGGIAGIIPAAMDARTYTFGGAGIFGTAQFINPTGFDSSFVAYILSVVIAFFGAAILTYLFGFNDKMVSSTKSRYNK